MKPNVRETWGMHSASYFLLGNSSEHYRCERIWVKDTHGKRVSDTIFLKHKYITMPRMTTSQAVLKAAEKMTSALEGVSPKNCQTEEAIKN